MLLGKKPIGTVATLLGLPAVLSRWAWDWGQMIAYNSEFLCGPDTYIHYDRSTFSDHAPARNGLAENFVGDWLVQFDTDHQFEPDIVGRLLHFADSAKVDVLSGFYQMKASPFSPVLFEWVDIGGKPGLQPIATWPDIPVMQIGSAGGGCLFVRRKVFDRIASELKQKPFDHIDEFSEDHSFFLRCKKLGIACWAAPRIRADHLRISGVTPEMVDTNYLVAGEPFAVKGFQ